MKRIEKDFSWLDIVDMEKIEFNRKTPPYWAWGMGGHPLDPEEYSISNITEDCEIRYKMPKCINEMLNLQKKFGADEAINKLRYALRI